MRSLERGPIHDNRCAARFIGSWWPSEGRNVLVARERGFDMRGISIDAARDVYDAGKAA